MAFLNIADWLDSKREAKIKEEIQAAAVADIDNPAGADAEGVATKVNELLGALRASGLVAQDA